MFDTQQNEMQDARDVSGPSHRINRAVRCVIIVRKSPLETDNNSRDGGSPLGYNSVKGRQ
jgi:hypothetical protein